MSTSIRIISDAEPIGRTLQATVFLSPTTVLPDLKDGEWYSLYETRYHTGYYKSGYSIRTALAGAEVEPTSVADTYIIRIVATTQGALKSQYRKALRYLCIETTSMTSGFMKIAMMDDGPEKDARIAKYLLRVPQEQRLQTQYGLRHLKHNFEEANQQ